MLHAAETITFGLAGSASARRPAEMLDEPKLSKAESRQASALVRLVRKLPASGSIVIVHAHGLVEAYRRCIRELRGDAVARETRVIAAPTLDTEEAATFGLKLPVFHDPMVEAQRAHRRALEQAWRL